VRDQLAALVLDGDMRAGLVAVRSLTRAGRPVGVVATRRNPPPVAVASRFPRLRVVLPHYQQDEGAYVAALLDLLRRHPAQVLLAMHDGTVEVLRKHRDELASRSALALAPEPALQMAVDKRSSLQVAGALGIAVPCGMTVTELAQVDAAARVAGFPCVVKPAVSWAAASSNVGRLQCASALNATELRTAVEHMLVAGAPALVQQWLPGRREAVHLMFAQGEFWARVCVVADRTAPALGGNAALRRTVPLIEDSVAAAERLVRELSLEGYSEVEFRRDADGVPVLMEINPRLSASVETAVRAGVDFPLLLQDWAVGAPLRRVDGYRVGVRLRWLGGDLRWMRESWRAPGRPDVPGVGRALGTVLTDTLRPSAYDYLDLGDPWPAVQAVTNVLGRRARRRKGRSV
jgi:predicted ATP-grasp superfamily ATP-dependent carboligase